VGSFSLATWVRVGEVAKPYVLLRAAKRGYHCAPLDRHAHGKAALAM